MFAAVLAIAYPNIALMETMSAGSTALCVLLVLAGMGTLLAPYLLEHLRENQKIAQDAKKTGENIDLIFENLSALQLMIAETRELGDQIEEKLAFQTAKDCELKFKDFKTELEQLRASVRAKLNDVNTAVGEAQTSAANAAAAAAGAQTTAANATAIAEQNALRLDGIAEDLERIGDSLFALEQASNSAPSADSAGDFDLESENPAAEEEEPEDPAEIDALPAAAEPASLEDAAEPAQPSLSEDEDFPSPPDFSDAPSPKPSKLDGIMVKALGNAMSAASVVEKIIAGSAKADAAEPAPAPEQPELDVSAQTVPAAEFEVSDADAQPAAEEQIDGESLLDDLDFDDAEKKTPPTDNLPQPAPIAEPQPSPAEPAADAETPPAAAAPAETRAAQEMLFAELPGQDKPAAAKKDSSIILRSLIGIGNKPYLRGDNSLLRPDKGTPMDYVEIGVWRAVLPPFEGELNFSIWKNDEQQIGDASYTLQSGKKQEISI